MRTVHKVCTMLKQWEALNRNSAKWEKCQECPARNPPSVYGVTVNGCRVAANEFVNIVKTGNPWGKKHCKWPD